MYTDTSKLPNYATTKALFAKARNKEKGKPLTTFSRLYKDGEDYVVRLNNNWRNKKNTDVAHISSDDKITFDLPEDDMANNCYTLVGHMYRVIPVVMERKRKGIYCLAGTCSQAAKEGGWTYVAKHGYEYFQGIQFDMVSGECLNPRPSMEDSLDKDKRTGWLRDLRRFKRGMKARAKVGAFESLNREVHAEIGNGGNRYEFRSNLPQWTDDRIVRYVLECMKNETYPEDLLRLFVSRMLIEGYYSNPPPVANALAYVDKMFNEHSLTFRKAYGVFGEGHE